MRVDARTALRRLQVVFDAGDLDRSMAELKVEVLGAFGSATRTEGDAHDLDIGVRFLGSPDVLRLVDVLTEVTGFDHVDVAVVDGSHPVIDAEALCGIPLYEATPGAFAEAQMAALGHRRDTARFRELDLERLAG